LSFDDEAVLVLLGELSRGQSPIAACRMSHELRTPLNAIIGLTEMMVTNRGAPRDETLQKRPDAGLKFGIVRSRGQENANAPHPLASLRTRRERPRRGRAAEKRHERAAPCNRWAHGQTIAYPNWRHSIATFRPST
jgi:His Kinase A (phospho-acceptor) domain